MESSGRPRGRGECGLQTKRHGNSNSRHRLPGTRPSDPVGMQNRVGATSSRSPSVARASALESSPVKAVLHALRGASIAIVLTALAVGLRALGDSWPLALVAWGAAGLAVVVLALQDKESSEVTHIAFAIDAL